MPHSHGHPRNHDLRSLKQLERGIEARLKIDHHLGQQDRREIDLATCFPAGKFMLDGVITDIQQTLDPEVMRGNVMQGGQCTGLIYINVPRKKCTLIDNPVHLFAVHPSWVEQQAESM